MQPAIGQNRCRGGIHFHCQRRGRARNRHRVLGHRRRLGAAAVAQFGPHRQNPARRCIRRRRQHHFTMHPAADVHRPQVPHHFAIHSVFRATIADGPHRHAGRNPKPQFRRVQQPCAEVPHVHRHRVALARLDRLRQRAQYQLRRLRARHPYRVDLAHRIQHPVRRHHHRQVEQRPRRYRRVHPRVDRDRPALPRRQRRKVPTRFTSTANRAAVGVRIRVR